MCGIAGILGSQAKETLVRGMVAALAHRGPDDSGIWKNLSESVVLGHARLSIIDLSPTGHQPMSFGNGRYWITFNGEIYNYKELQVELEKRGFSFTSHSDTEIVLAAFVCWGVNSFEHLRGMFAFAIWDQEENRLVLARDRLGIKPLLWAKTADGLVFASEIKAMLASKLVESVIEPDAIYDLLTIGSICQPGTILRGVQSLEPGTCMVAGIDGTLQTIQYWDAKQSAALLRPELAKLSYADSVILIREKLEEACRYHLIADVPVGSFLSGGIDSTAVTALMARHMTDKVKSFSIGFQNTPDLKNELGDARLAAQYIGTDHTEIVLTGRDMSEAFDDHIRAIDQPSYDGTNTYFVSRAASASVKVTLSGLGGDELFAGYPHFLWLQDAVKRKRRGVDSILSVLHRLRPNRLTRSAELRTHTLEQRYANLRRSFSDDAISISMIGLLKSGFQPGFLEAYIKPILDEHLDSLSQTSLVEIHHYLPNTLLRDADAMSMGHGLEVRPVLLDHVLVEHALALPPDAKIRNGMNKAILVDAVRDLLPPTLLARPKTGFQLPLDRWLRSDLRERMVACLESPWVYGVFDPFFLKKQISNLDHRGDTKLLWTLLILTSWANEYHCALPDYS